MRFFIFTVLFICSVITGFGQEVIISHDPPPARANYPDVKTLGNAQVVYNKTKDVSIAQTKGDRVYGQGMDSIIIRPEFESDGKTVIEPKSVTLNIFYVGKDHAYVENRNLKVVADGNEILSGISTFIRANESNMMIAHFAADIPFSDFTKISKAKIVTMQIGPASVVLKSDVIKGFDDLVQIIKE